VCFPEWHPRAGQSGPVNAFLIQHPDGPILVDTGIGPTHPDIDAMYRPTRYALLEALASVGVAIGDIRLVVNTHLHFDHCGSNSLFPGTPIFVQGAEFEAAQAEDYTIREYFDFPDAQYRLLRGQAELAPAVRVLPTPGHTHGHQSVVVDSEDGPDIIAGQAAETAEQFMRPEAESEEGATSLRLLHDLTPARVYFSHDHAVWERSIQE
jgi:glyoxylase-like metal-dependent hydrolase (beta-lactamase superfamily II)